MKIIGLDELKKIELNLLVHFAAYCGAHNLRYYLYAGTLLGAVRHKGFIPWDDDIDVCMPRPDYERFYQLVKKEPISPEIGAITYRDVDTCLCPFIKLQDLRTEGHEEDLREEFQTSVWIDIFPMDGVPADDPTLSGSIRHLNRLVRLISLSSRPFVPCKDPLRLLKRYYIFKRYSKVNLNDVNAEIESIAMRNNYDDCELVGSLVFTDIPQSISPRAGYDNPVMLEFEGHQFPAPSNYDECLTSFYGDYMTPPPEKDRIPHAFRAWWKPGFEPAEE